MLVAPLNDKGTFLFAYCSSLQWKRRDSYSPKSLKVSLHESMGSSVSVTVMDAEVYNQKKQASYRVEIGNESG